MTAPIDDTSPTLKVAQNAREMLKKHTPAWVGCGGCKNRADD